MALLLSSAWWCARTTCHRVHIYAALPVPSYYKDCRPATVTLDMTVKFCLVVYSHYVCLHFHSDFLTAVHYFHKLVCVHPNITLLSARLNAALQLLLLLHLMALTYARASQYYATSAECTTIDTTTTVTAVALMLHVLPCQQYASINCCTTTPVALLLWHSIPMLRTIILYNNILNVLYFRTILLHSPLPSR